MAKFPTNPADIKWGMEVIMNLLLMTGGALLTVGLTVYNADKLQDLYEELSEVEVVVPVAVSKTNSITENIKIVQQNDMLRRKLIHNLKNTLEK